MKYILIALSLTLVGCGSASHERLPFCYELWVGDAQPGKNCIGSGGHQ